MNNPQEFDFTEKFTREQLEILNQFLTAVCHNIINCIIKSIENNGLEKTLEDMRSVCTSRKDYSETEYNTYLNWTKTYDELRKSLLNGDNEKNNPFNNLIS